MARAAAKNLADSTVSDNIEEVADDSVDPSSSLGNVLASLHGSSESRITVYRADKNTPLSYLFECHPDSFTLAELRDKYNGGQFRLYISKDSKLFRNIMVSVASPVKPAGPSFAPDQADITIAMRDGFGQMATMLRDAIVAMRPAPTPPVDVVALMTAMGGFLSSMRQSDPAPAPAAATAVNPSTFVDVLLKGVELGKSFVPGAEGDGGGLLGMVKELIKSPLAQAAVSAAVQQQQQPAPQPRPNPPPAPRVAVARAPDVSAPAPHPQPSGENAVLARYVAQLVQWAKDETDPDVYAIMIVDNVPEAMVRSLIFPADAIDRIAAMNPAVNAYRPWFDALRQRVIAHMDGESEDSLLAGTNIDLTAGEVGANNTADVHRPDPADLSRDDA